MPSENEDREGQQDPGDVRDSRGAIVVTKGEIEEQIP